MSPRISLTTARGLTFRARSIVPQKRFAPGIQNRTASDDATKTATQKSPADANQTAIPHVTEERAAIDEVMGEEPPEIEEHGTPVQEILQRDKDAQEKAPEVLKKEFKSQKPGSGQARSYSTSARRRTEMEAQKQMSVEPVHVHFEGTQVVGLEYPDAGLGHKFPLPDPANFKRTDHLRRRYDGMVDQVTKSLMRHGKLSRAQANMGIILDTLRTAPPPQFNPQFPGRKLLSDDLIKTEKLTQPAVARDALSFSPIQYLTTAIDSVAPLVKIRQQRGVMGGGASLPIPVPLRIKARRRTAIQWILDSAANRKEVRLADRVAREIINVAEGKSSVWDKRALVHKTAISARSNVRLMMMRRRR